ncbi:hypothetical protein HD806DRAFT_65698 [Xylariaceae sp. AK1471]|nr:hypothetical protein HD806DRAFT_65698 [Xylariaceae sp. AK1471]
MSKSPKPLTNTTTSLTASSGPPAWLFTNNSTSFPATQLATTPDTMAKKDKKTHKAKKQQSEKPPAQLMDLVESFLSDQGFDNAHREFRKHRATKAWKGLETGKGGTKEHQSLVSVFQTWETFASKDSTPNTTTKTTVEKVSSSSDDSSNSSSSDESSDEDSGDDIPMADAPTAETSSSESSSSDSSSESESQSESDSDDEKPKTSKPPTKVAPTKSLKRKAESDSESSSSDLDSDSDSDITESKSKDVKKPQSKKLKTEESSDESSLSESSSESDSSDDDSSDDDNEEAKPKTTKKPQSNSDSSSESDSDDSSSNSESESESEDEIEAAAKVPLPESDDSSDSESESEKEKPKINAKGKVTIGTASDSSATLEKTASPEFAPLPPNPTTFKANNRGNGLNSKKTQNQPFSRISNNVEIDPRLSSNAYVSHGYGEQAHRDLIVTKGKGFTKEKNKKKRGSYKGGPLDVHMSRSFKFDD